MNCSLHFSLKCWKNNDQWNAIKLGKRSIFYFFTLFISFSKHRIIFHFDALFLAGLQLLEDQPRWPMAYEIFERVKIEPPLALHQNSWVTSIFPCSMLVCNVQETNCWATIWCGFYGTTQPLNLLPKFWPQNVIIIAVSLEGQGWFHRTYFNGLYLSKFHPIFLLENSAKKVYPLDS